MPSKIVPGILSIFLWLCICRPYLRDFSVVLMCTSVPCNNRAITKAIKMILQHLELTFLQVTSVLPLCQFHSKLHSTPQGRSQVTVVTSMMNKVSQSHARAEGRPILPEAVQAPRSALTQHFPAAGSRTHALSSRHVCNTQCPSRHHWEKLKVRREVRTLFLSCLYFYDFSLSL